MKLRVRALNSTETLRIDIPSDSSLQHLRQAIALAVPLSSPDLRLSLNRSDELSASSPSDSLLSLGLAAGDLVFYSVAASDHLTLRQGSASTSQALSVEARSAIGEETMESERFPESRFVRRLVRVLGRESGNEGFDRKSIVLAVHCVLLESGFFRFDPVSGKKIEDELRFPSSMAFSVSSNYSLPSILEKNERHSVVLKFQSLKHFINVFGSLTGGGSGSVTYRLCLDERSFAAAIRSLCEGNDDGISKKALYKLWKIVKDGLTFPLTIDLCSKARVPCPACFSRLPPDLQTKIVALLPGDDLARAACACKELRQLTSDDELWLLKLTEEFTLENLVESRRGSWKSVFAQCRQRKRRAEEERAARRVDQLSQVWPAPPFFGPPMFGFPPNPLELPRIGGIGGDFNHIRQFAFVVPQPAPQDLNGDYYRFWGGPRCNNCTLGNRF